MKYKFGEMDSKKITKRLLITIALIFLLPMILEIFNMIILPGTSGDSTVVKIQALVFIIVGILKPILIAVLLVFCGEALYKVLKAAQIIIEKEKNN